MFKERTSGQLRLGLCKEKRTDKCNFNRNLIRICNSELDSIDGDLGEGFHQQDGTGISGQGILVSASRGGSNSQLVETTI